MAMDAGALRDSMVKRGMVNDNTVLCHHLLQIA